MPLLHGATKAAARERYRHYFQDSLACISEAAFFYISKPPLTQHDDDQWALSTQPAPIPLLTTNGHLLYLTAAQTFRCRRKKGEWGVSTQEYIYNVGEAKDTRDYLIAWHWHPFQEPEACHLHADADLGNGMKLSRKHLPTARVSFEEILWFLIDEFDVDPAKGRDECRAILSERQARHERHRTWWGSKKP